MTLPTSSKPIIFLHSLSAVNYLVASKALKIAHEYTTMNVIGFRVQLVSEPRRQQLRDALLCRLYDAIAQYMWYGESQARFLVLSKRSEGLSSLE